MNESYGTRSLREIVRILFQHWVLIFFFVLILTGGTWLYCRILAPTTYRSTISLIFKQPTNRSPISSDSHGDRKLEVFVKSQQQIVMSDLVMARTMVISKDDALRTRWFELRKKWEEARKEGDGRIRAALEEINAWLDTAISPKVQTVFSGQQEDLKDFTDSIKLQTPGGEQVGMTETFTLRVDRKGDRNINDSHMWAHYAADVLADMYMIRYLQLQQELNAPAENVMEDVVTKFADGELKQATDAYTRFVTANSDKIGVLEQLLKSGTEHGVQVVLTKMRENEASLQLELTRDRSVYEALSKALPAKALEPGGIAEMSDAEVAEAISVVSMGFFRENLLFLEMSKNLAGLEIKKSKIEAQYTEDSRDVQYIREEVARNKRRLLEQLVCDATGLNARIDARSAQRAMYCELVRQTADEQKEIHAKLADYARLKNDFEVAQKHLEKLQQDRIDAKSTKLITKEAVTISKLDEATKPDPERPIIPMTWIYTAVAFAVSLLLGIAFSFLADHFDHTLRSTGEAERYLGVPVLGSVKRRGRSLIVGT